MKQKWYLLMNQNVQCPFQTGTVTMRLFILQWQHINVYNKVLLICSILVIIYINNCWFWLELPGAGKQYFILENCRDQFTLGSMYASLVHNF